MKTKITLPLGVGLMGCLTWSALLALVVWLGGLSIEYVVETWAAVFDKSIDIPHGVALWAGGFLLAKVFIPAAILTWIIASLGLLA